MRYSMGDQSRRKYLQTAGAAAIVGTGGCLGVNLGGADDTERTSPTESSDTTPSASRDSGWLASRGGPSQLLFNPVSGPPARPTEQWTTTIPETSRHVLTRNGFIILVDSATGGITAYDADSAEEAWTTSVADGRIRPSNAVIGGETVAVGAVSDGEQFTTGVDIASGEERWRNTSGQRTVGTTSQAVYTLGRRDDIVTLDIRRQSGEISRRIDLPQGHTPAATAGETLITQSNPERDTRQVAAVSLSDGAVQWRATLPGPRVPPTAAVQPVNGIAMTGQTVFALYDRNPDSTNTQSSLVALATTDGAERWRLYSDSEIPPAARGNLGRGVQRIAGRPGQLVVQEFSSRVRYLSEQDGTEETTLNQDSNATPVAVDAGTVYRIEASDDGGRRLVAADGANDRWAFSDIGPIQQVVPDDDRLFVWQQSEEAVRLVAYA